MTSKRNAHWLAAELDDLVASGVLERDAALRVRTHYREAVEARPSVPLFAVLGAALTGLGVILLVAHNWETFSRTLELGIGFGILAVGQGAAVFAGFRRRDSVAWTEAAALAASFAVAACLAIVSQAYQLPGDVGRFIQTWCWLSLPVAYALDARTVIALVLSLIATRVFDLGFDRDPMSSAWALLAASLPYLGWLATRRAHGLRDSLVAWVAAPTLVVFVLMQGMWESASLFGLLTLCVASGLYAVGSDWGEGAFAPFASAPARVFGVLGTFAVLLVFSYDASWRWRHDPRQEWIDLLPAIGLAGLSALFVVARLRDVIRSRDLASGLLVVSPLAFVLAGLVAWGTRADEAGTWFLSLFTAVVGGTWVVSGARLGSALRANSGMLLLGAVITLRFMLSDLGFLQRGLIFIALGVTLIALNFYLHVRRRRAGESS